MAVIAQANNSEDAGLNPTPLPELMALERGQRCHWTVCLVHCSPAISVTAGRTHYLRDSRENPLFARCPKTSDNTLEMSAWLTGPSRQQIVSDFQKTTNHLRAVTRGVHPSLLCHREEIVCELPTVRCCPGTRTLGLSTPM